MSSSSSSADRQTGPAEVAYRDAFSEEAMRFLDALCGGSLDVDKYDDLTEPLDTAYGRFLLARAKAQGFTLEEEDVG